MTAYQPDPLDLRHTQELREASCPEPTPLDLFLAGVTDWQQFVAEDEAYRAAQGLPPVPELTPEQERSLWISLACKVAERRAGQQRDGGAS